MMKTILSKLNSYLPMKEFLNYFFITALGDYIQTEINISSLEKEISQKAVISLNGLKLNTSVINERHLTNSPMKLIEGRINKLEMSLTDDKISIHISEVTMLVMPVFDSSKLFKYQNSICHPKTSTEIQSINQNQTIVESIMNSMMQNIDITIDSICIKILTYEVFENSLDNPTISIFISKINCQSKHVLKEGQCFLFNKTITLHNFCIKIDQYNTQDEVIFNNACKLQDNKLLFNFFCSNNTLCCIDYNKGPGISITISQADNRVKETNPPADLPKNDYMKVKDQIKIDVSIQRIEFIANSTQITQLIMFNTICNNIYTKNNDGNTSNKALIDNKVTSKKDTEMNLFGHIIRETYINVSFELINVLINENITAKETPKLFSFYSEELYKIIKTIDEIETHFCYFEDNYFVLIIENMTYSSFESSSFSKSSFGLNQVVIDYVEYQSKQAKRQSTTKMPQLMKMGSGSKIALSQMQSCCNESVYQSAQSGSNASIYESVIDSELVLIENFNKLIAYDFFNSSFRILNVDKIEGRGYVDSTSTFNHSIINLDISSISIDFHFIFLFKIIKLLYANNLLVKYNEKNKLNQSQTIESKENSNEKVITSEKSTDNKDIIKNPVIINKDKNQVFLSIKSLGIKLYNFKRENSLIDINPFFNEYFKTHIEYFYLNKVNAPFYQMPHHISIDSMKSKDYLLFKLSEFKLLTITKQKELEIKGFFRQIILNYNYYTLISFAKSEYPSIIIKGRKNEYVTGLVAPVKSSYIESNEKDNYEGNLNDKIDINIISNKNEMALRNHCLQIKSQYDYKEHSSTLRIALNVNEEIHINCEYLLIKQLLLFSDTLLFPFNIIQIYNSYCSKINESLIQKVFQLHKLPQVIKNIGNESKTNIFISMDISNLTLFLNKNNTMDKEGNLLKIIFRKVAFVIAFRYAQPMNETEITIDQIQMFIKKNTQPKEDVRQSHNTLLKKIAAVNKNEDASNYTLLLSKTDDGKIQDPMISVHISFNNLPNKKEIINLIDHQELTSINCYEMFLLQNQLPIPDMNINLQLIITSCYINPLWYDFDLQNNGLSFLIEEINSTEEDYNNNDQHVMKELIPLCQERKIEGTISLELQSVYLDLFYAMPSIPKKDWMRMILMIKSVKLLQKEGYSEIMLNQCRVFYLNNLDYNGVEKIIGSTDLILKVIDDIPKETSYLNRIGFIEMCFIENLQLSKKNNRINNELQKINISMSISAIEVFLCKDSFLSLQNFVFEINKYFEKLKAHFTHEKLIINDDSDEQEEKINNNVKSNNINSPKQIKNEEKKEQFTNPQNDHPTKKKNDLQKEYHIIENYCFNPDSMDKKLTVIEENETEEDLDNKFNNKKPSRKSLSKDPKNQESEDYSTEFDEEGDVQIIGNINIIRIYLFKGRDFAFIQFAQSSNKTVINYNSIEGYDDLKNIHLALDIDDDYMTNTSLNANSSISILQTRPRKKQRDYMNHICFYLSDLKGDISYFNESEILLACIITLSKFTIEDRIKLSKYSKLLSKYNYEDNMLHFCSIKLEMLRNTKESSSEELQLSLDIQLSPINILLDQITLIFLLQFFQIKLDLLNDLYVDDSNIDLPSEIDRINNTMPPKSKDLPLKINDTYLSDIGEFERINKDKLKGNNKENDEDNSSSIILHKFSIKTFYLNFCYNSHELSIQQLKSNNYLELLNISNITDFQVRFKGYDCRETKTLNDSLIGLIEYWKNDITKNQIVSAVLHSVAVVRPFVAIFDSVFDLVKQPWISYRKEHNIKKGMRRGIKSFFSTFTTQSLFIGEKTFMIIQKMLGTTGSNTLNKNSYYKKWMYKINDGKRKYDDHFLKK